MRKQATKTKTMQPDALERAETTAEMLEYPYRTPEAMRICKLAELLAHAFENDREALILIQRGAIEAVLDYQERALKSARAVLLVLDRFQRGDAGAEEVIAAHKSMIVREEVDCCVSSLACLVTQLSTQEINDEPHEPGEELSSEEHARTTAIVVRDLLFGETTIPSRFDECTIGLMEDVMEEVLCRVHAKTAKASSSKPHKLLAA